MKRATTFMVEKVSTNGGFVWVVPAGLVATMGRARGARHADLDSAAGHGDDGPPVPRRVSRDRRRVLLPGGGTAAARSIWAQLPSGGWNYLADFAGDRSLSEWYDTIGRNAWRLEEFQHYWGNGTFDDAGTAESAKLLLRLYVEKRDPRYKPALDKAIQFVLDSQYPVGFWPQRFPLRSEFSHHGLPDYTSYPTFNDDVAGENIDFLVLCYQGLGDARLLDPITRGMNAFLVAQQGPPQPGWALHTRPTASPPARAPTSRLSLTTHTTATNIGLLLRFYRLTGDTRYLARVPAAHRLARRPHAASGRRARPAAPIRRSSSSAPTSRCTCTAKARTW